MAAVTVRAILCFMDFIPEHIWEALGDLSGGKMFIRELEGSLIAGRNWIKQVKYCY